MGLLMFLLQVFEAQGLLLSCMGKGGAGLRGTTRRGTATPVHRPHRPAGSTHSSTRGLCINTLTPHSLTRWVGGNHPLLSAPPTLPSLISHLLPLHHFLFSRQPSTPARAVWSPPPPKESVMHSG